MWSANCTTRSSRCSAMQDGEAEVVDEPLQGGEDLFGRCRVERRRRLVEHQHPGVLGEDGGDGGALLLTAGERAQRALPHVVEAEEVERLLDATPHDLGGQPQRLHAVGDLVLDDLGDEAVARVLQDDADDVGQLARWVVAGVTAVDGDASGQTCHR